MMTIAEKLENWIAENMGDRIGQIVFWEHSDDGVFRVCHQVDEVAAKENRPDSTLTRYEKLIDAIEISKFNIDDDYRPLKTSPDLISGWLLEVQGVAELLAAIDYFYPAMVGSYFALTEGRTEPISMRANLNRQTGMYRYARTIEDEDAQELIGGLCNAGKCLKRVMWDIDDEGTKITSLPPVELTPKVPKNELPLLCLEPCCLFVAAARVAAKKAFAAKNSS